MFFLWVRLSTYMIWYVTDNTQGFRTKTIYLHNKWMIEYGWNKQGFVESVCAHACWLMYVISIISIHVVNLNKRKMENSHFPFSLFFFNIRVTSFLISFFTNLFIFLFFALVHHFTNFFSLVDLAGTLRSINTLM